MNNDHHLSKLHQTLDDLNTDDATLDFFRGSSKGKISPAEAGETGAEETKPSSWLDSDDTYEGQLSVDVFQTDEAIIIQSTIAGVKPEDIDISIQNDMITIRGKRSRKHTTREEDYLYQECYWGGFSRSIILPVEIRSDKAEADMENGILTIFLPKANKTKVTTLTVKEKNI